MPSTDLINEAKRVMRICNSCRYCEGFCAVFPAMELRRTFTSQDMKYMANLCHNCRDCYYACQYAPPHEFELNFPKTMAALRFETYKEFAGPKVPRHIFDNNGSWVGFISIVSIIFMLLCVMLIKGPAVLTTPFTGANSFYAIFPYAGMVTLFLAVLLFSCNAFVREIKGFCRETGMSTRELCSPGAHFRAIKDTLRLRYLDGGGDGCNYPDDRFRKDRKWWHHLVFYGFLLCLASTTIAAFKDHFLHIPAPYPVFSLPVMLGIAGGISMVMGTGGLFYLKKQMDQDPAEPAVQGMDSSFILLLFFTALSGLVLLALRETAFMGGTLIIHLALVLALFVTMPFGKFVHGIYRYLALVKNAVEQSDDAHKA